LPPLTQAEWREAFAKYQASPEYRLVNDRMDLAGFQGIFWLEYLHRLWGRLIGLAFVLPLAVLAARRLIDRRLAGRLGLLFGLGAAQGALGWYMVASGLIDRPEISHFRLAAHLVLAVVILGALLWSALDRVAPPAARASDTLRRAIDALLVLALLVVTWGAFVAGLDAGRIHNTFPLMDGGLFPNDGLVRQPGWLNAFETPAAVQYVHRILAVTLVACVTLLAWWARMVRQLWLAAGWAWMQAGLGIATLVLAVPVPLAALHQMGAVLLFALLVWARHTIRRRTHERRSVLY
jgi:cytochrome c oxidase assembly protein subunit 15